MQWHPTERNVPPTSMLTHDNYSEQFVVFFSVSILRIFMPGALVMWTYDICTLSCSSPWDIQVPKRVVMTVSCCVVAMYPAQWRCKVSDVSLLNDLFSAPLIHAALLIHTLLEKAFLSVCTRFWKVMHFWLGKDWKCMWVSYRQAGSYEEFCQLVLVQNFLGRNQKWNN